MKDNRHKNKTIFYPMGTNCPRSLKQIQTQGSNQVWTSTYQVTKHNQTSKNNRNQNKETTSMSTIHKLTRGRGKKVCTLTTSSTKRTAVKILSLGIVNSINDLYSMFSFLHIFSSHLFKFILSTWTYKIV